MTIQISQLLPDAEILIQMGPEELAWPLLILLRDTQRPNPQNLIHGLFQFHANQYDLRFRDQVQQALLEAWLWLENQGLLAAQHNPSGPPEYFITKRGDLILSEEDFSGFLQASLLPKDILHPSIVGDVWGLFMRGDYDTAIFRAFKEVEVAVRTAGEYSDGDYGVDLMRAAFHKDTGPLTDSSRPAAERENLSHLFAGAIGSYKNPHSHRTVVIGDPGEAVEIIMLASHLLRIVEARSTE